VRANNQNIPALLHKVLFVLTCKGNSSKTTPHFITEINNKNLGNFQYGLFEGAE